MNDILTPNDLSARWGVTTKHLANQRSAKTGPAYIKLGGRVRYRLSDVIAYENNRIVTTHPLGAVAA